MLPEVFPMLAGDGEVVSMIGSAPVRAYEFGFAPQTVAVPYVTWFLSSGRPDNCLDGVAPVDEDTVQVDCWARSRAEAKQLAQAVREAIEPEQYLTSVSGVSVDPDTKRFRITLTFTFWTPRP